MKPITWRADLTTCLLCTWLIAGVFVDGWAHNTRPKLETFFTPWHALFYSGFAATAVWVGSTMLPGIRSGLGLRHSAPPGYGWAMAGLAIFAAAGVGDLTWHLLFGIEQNIAALLSPTHLGLLGGAILIVTAPWRSARADPDLDRRPSFGRLFPAVLSLTLAGSGVAFMLQEWHPIKENLISAGANRDLVVHFGGHEYGDPNMQIRAGVAAFILASIFLFGPMLLLMRTWVLPRGAALVLIGLQCVLMQSQTGFADGGLAVLGVMGAVAVEGLVLVVRPKPVDRGRLRLFFFLAPPLFWAVYVLGILVADRHLGWKAELWGGSLAWSALTMLALATVVTMAPPVIEHRQGPSTPAGPDQIATMQDGEAIRAQMPDPSAGLSSGTS